MPSRPCKHPTCTAYVAGGDRYCADHAAIGRAERLASTRVYDQHQRDPDAKRFYNSAAWLAVRKAVLATYPICQRCIEAYAAHVHHVKPLADCSPAERVDPTNLLALCASCHAIIEAERARGRQAVA